MTPAQLVTILKTLLSDVLGTYTSSGGTSLGSACRVGEPPADQQVTGLEVIVDVSPEFDNEPLHAHTAIGLEFPVRVIPRGSASGQVAVTRICQRFQTSNPVTVPANERLGILTQYTLRVRSQ